MYTYVCVYTFMYIYTKYEYLDENMNSIGRTSHLVHIIEDTKIRKRNVLCIKL